MKKSTIILILLIYIAAIAAVGFFGMQIVSYYEVIIPEKVEITNEDLKTTTDAGGTYKYVVLDYEEDLVYWLSWRVFPENAKQDVVFVYDEASTTATVDNVGRVYFNKKGTITITIRTAEFNTIYDKVKIIAI